MHTKQSIYLLIILDTLLLRPSLHFTTLHPTTLHLTPLHYTCRHFTSSHLNFTQLHFPTLSFVLNPFKFPTAPFHLTSLHLVSLHFTALLDDLLTVLFLSFQPLYNCFPNSVSKNLRFTRKVLTLQLVVGSSF
jgi:hypothetical protein